MISCPACGEPMSKMCYECGAFFDEPEYIVYDLYNYRTLPKRCYRREDHFKEVLAQFQGSEGKEIPRQLLDQIKAEIKDVEKTNQFEIKQILRKLKLTKYVENTNSITFALTGQQPPYIKREIQDKMVRLFKQIVRAWDTIIKDKRQSFLNYYFVVYKLLDLMDQNELLPKIPMLRTPLRIRRHDRIWWRICEELGWTFKPTLPQRQPRQKKQLAFSSP